MGSHYSWELYDLHVQASVLACYMPHVWEYACSDVILPAVGEFDAASAYVGICIRCTVFVTLHRKDIHALPVTYHKVF